MSFVLSLLVSSLLLGRILPIQDIPVVRSKLAWLAEHGDDFDTIFIGSSRVQSQIVPSIFDATATSLGHPVHAFNAGVAGMFPPEDAFMLEQILRRPHRRLRWAFVELMPFETKFAPAATRTERMVYWHDGRRMWWQTRHALADLAEVCRADGKNPGDGHTSCSQILGNWWGHLECFGLSQANLGRGAAWFSWHRSGGWRKGDEFDHGGPAGDGWVSPGHRALEGERLARYQTALSSQLGKPRRHFEDETGEAALGDILDLLAQNGVRPILFIPPALGDDQFYPTRTLQNVPFFDFSDTLRFAPLYAVENRMDNTHVNLTGAEIFTRELASLFIQHTANSTGTKAVDGVR